MRPVGVTISVLFAGLNNRSTSYRIDPPAREREIRFKISMRLNKQNGQFQFENLPQHRQDLR